MISILYFFFIKILSISIFLFFFFFNDTATTEIYTLSLHDALPILRFSKKACGSGGVRVFTAASSNSEDRKSTRLNSSHGYISYAVFCLKKKKINYSFVLYILNELHTGSIAYNLVKIRV